MEALAALEEAEKKDEVLTGVLYVNTEKPNFLEMLTSADEPLATLPEARSGRPKRCSTKSWKSCGKRRPANPWIRANVSVRASVINWYVSRPDILMTAFYTLIRTSWLVLLLSGCVAAQKRN